MLPPRALRVLRDLSRIRTSASALNSISHVIQLPQPATWMSVLGMSSMAATTAPAGTKAIAVVGGGISGLHCAHVLSQRGFTVTVFDLGKHSPGERFAACICGSTCEASPAHSALDCLSLLRPEHDAPLKCKATPC